MKIATEQLWSTYHEKLLRFIRKRVTDDEAAQDLLQETFLRIHTRLHTLTQGEKLESWVYQIARNLIIDYYRQRKLTVALDDVELVAEMPEEDVQANLLPTIPWVLQGLSVSDREALLLTDYQGLSQKELAQRMGLSSSGAKSRVQRARAKLRRMYLNCCHFEFDRFGHVIDYYPRSQCC